MRIVRLANFVTPTSGGLRTVLDQLGDGYRVAGHEAHLVRPAHPDDDDDAHPLEHLVPSRPLPLSGGYRIAVERDPVVRTLEHLAPDRIEVHDRTTLGWVAGWARSAGIPVVVVVHERLAAVVATVTRLGPAAHVLADVLDRRLVATEVPLVVPSTWASSSLVGPHVHVVPWGVDLALFHPTRRRRPPGGATLRLVMVGRLSREKAPGTGVEVLRRLVRRGVRVHLNVVGDGPLRQRVEHAAAGLPVTFHGHVRDRAVLATMMADADVGLLPGPQETFGLAALELLATGTPVVAPRRGGVVDVIGPGGGIVTDQDVGMLASAAQRLVERAYAERRAAARRTAEAFPWSRAVARMLALQAVPPVASGEPTPSVGSR